MPFVLNRGGESSHSRLFDCHSRHGFMMNLTMCECVGILMTKISNFIDTMLCLKWV